MAIAGYLYFKVSQSAVATGGPVGPDTWPKAILVLAFLTCLFAIARNLIVSGASLPASDRGSGATEDRRLPRPLLWGAGLTVAYVALVSTVGFFLCSLLYLAGFMWVGGFRRSRALAAISVIGALAFMFVFMKIVYVSLPLGTGPFAALSHLLMNVMGIR